MNKFVRDWNQINDKIEKAKVSSGYTHDERFWKVNRDKEGNFAATIRFLPAPGDSAPYVTQISHKIYGHRNGKKALLFSAECPTTIGEQCPVCDANSACMDHGDKTTPKGRFRNKQGIANILVIADSQTPANNGKVFLWKFPKTITDKIESAKRPSKSLMDAGVRPVEVADYFSGANFRLIITSKDIGADQPQADYSQSNFDNSSILYNGDEKMLEIVEGNLKPLDPFIDVKGYKSYSDIETEFNDYLNKKKAHDSSGGVAQNEFSSRVAQPSQLPTAQATAQPSVPTMTTPVQQPVASQPVASQPEPVASQPAAASVANPPAAFWSLVSQTSK